MRYRLAVVTVVMALTSCGSQGPPQESNTDDAAASSGGSFGYTSSEEALADLAEMLQISDPPVVEVVREITPAESKQVVDECLADRGWPVVDGGIEFAPDQEASLNMDIYRCSAMYPIRQEYLEPLDDAAWGRIYDYWVSETLPCLRSEGLDVEDPPTRETFLGSRAWTPDNENVRDQVMELVQQGEYPAAEHVFVDVCPVTPPPEVRFGTP